MKNRIKELDYLRGFAILAVIMIHTSAYFTTVGSLTKVTGVMLFIDEFAHYAVPLFISISGFVLYYNYSSKFNTVIYYKKRLLSVIPQYIFFSCMYMAYFDKANLIKGTTSITLKIFINNLIFAYSAYHLWFFIILLQLYFLYPVIVKVYKYFKQKNKIDNLILGTLIIQVSWNMFIYLIFPKVNQFNIIILFIKKIRFVFFSHIFYFMIGIYVADNINFVKEVISKIRIKFISVLCIFLTIAIVLILIRVYFYNGNGFMSSAFILLEPILFCLTFILLYKISKTLCGNRSILSSIIYNFGVYSFGIYLVHVFYVIEVHNQLLKMNIQTYNKYFYMLLFIAVSALSYVSVMLINYIPFSKYIIGTHAVRKVKDNKDIDVQKIV